MLCEHVGSAEAGVGRVLGRFLDGVEGGSAFQDLEAVGGDEIGLGGLVHAVVGAADPLHDPARALRRSDIDHEVDVAPVDSEIEGRGADDGAQLPGRHRRLDPPPLRHVEGAVMQGDRQRILVEAPEFLEGVLGLKAGVDEDQDGAVPADQVVDGRHGLAGGVAGERKGPAGDEHVKVGRGAAADDHEVGHRGEGFPPPCGEG